MLTMCEYYADGGAEPRLRFTGWLQGIGNTIQAYLNSFPLNGPVAVYSQFLLAGAVTIATNQPGLQVLADRTPVFSPVTLDWGGVGTTHTVGDTADRYAWQAVGLRFPERWRRCDTRFRHAIARGGGAHRQIRARRPRDFPDKSSRSPAQYRRAQ